MVAPIFFRKLALLSPPLSDPLSLLRALRPSFLWSPGGGGSSGGAAGEKQEAVKDRDSRIEQLQNELDVLHAALMSQQVKVNQLEQVGEQARTRGSVDQGQPAETGG